MFRQPSILLGTALLTIAGLGMADTVVEEELFSLNLPGTWFGAYDADSDSWQYRNVEGVEGVTVSILGRTGGASIEAIRRDYENFIDVRRSKEIELSQGGMVLSEPEVIEFPDAILAKFSGFDSATDRRTFTLIIVNQRAVGSFYLEASGTDAPAFAARANEVFGQVGLVGRGD